MTSLKAPVFRIAKAAAVARTHIEECERVLELGKRQLENVSSNDPAFAKAMRRFGQLGAGLEVAKAHAEHELHASILLNAHGSAFLVEHETKSDLPAAWAARETFLLAKRKKRQVDEAQIAAAHALQTGASTKVADPEKKCWNCDGSGHISRNCPELGPTPACGRSRGRGKKGKK